MPRPKGVNMNRLFFCFVILLLLVSTSCEVTQASHVVQPAADYTNKDFLRDYEAFVQKMVIEPYKKHTKDQGLAKEKVLHFLDAYRDFVVRDIGDRAALKKLGEEAQEAGSQDPQFLAHVAYSVIDDGSAYKKTSGAALKKLKNTPYPAFTAFKLRVGQLKWYKNPKHRKWLIADLKKQMLLTFKEVEAPGQRFIWEFALAASTCSSVEYEILSNAVEKAKGLDPWLQSMFVGTYKRKMAWEARGIGFAGTVSKDGWEVFYRLLGEAQVEFEKAIDLQPGFPEAATAMIWIAMEGRDAEKSPRGYFEDATAAQMDWSEAYVKLLRTMEPRWGGSIEQMADFGIECAETERFDTVIPWEIITCYKYALREEENILVNANVYQAVKEVCQEYAARAAKQGDLDGVRKYESYLAASAFKAKKHEDIIAALERIDNEMDNEAFEDMGVIGDGLLGRTVARISPAAELCESLHAALRAGEIDPDSLTEEVRELREIREQVPSRGKVHVDALINQAIAAIAYEKGEWAEVKFEKGLIGWKRYGSWIAEPKTNSVLLKDFQRSKLLWDYPVKAPYMLEVDVEILKSGGTWLGERAGVRVGNYDRLEDRGALAFVDGRKGSIGFYDPKGNCFTYDSVDAKVRRMRVHAWEGVLAVTVNNGRARIISEAEVDPTGSMGLANMSSHPKEQVVRFSNFRIRKLQKEPPVGERSDSVGYWNQWLKSEPDSAYALCKRGISRGEESADNLDAAIEDLIASVKLNPNLQLAFSYLGAFYTEKAQFAKAKAAYLKSIANTPADRMQYNDFVIHHLAYIEASSSDETLRDSDSALERAMLLKKLFPKQPFRDVLVACAWAANGDFDKAVRFQQKAIKAEPESSYMKDWQERLTLYKAGKPFVYSAEPRTIVTRKGTDLKPVKWPTPMITEGLIGRWPFNSDITETVNELETETINGRVNFNSVGKVDQAVKFKAREYVSVPRFADFSGGPFSYGGWIFSGQGAGSICRQVDNATGAAHELGLGRGKNNNRTLEFRLSSGSDIKSQIKIKAKSKIALDEWQHVFVTCDGSGKAAGAKIYINGKQVKTAVLKDNLKDDIQNNGPFNIGQFSGAYSFFTGAMDEIRVYDRALSPEEVAKVAEFGKESTSVVPAATEK